MRATAYNPADIGAFDYSSMFRTRRALILVISACMLFRAAARAQTSRNASEASSSPPVSVQQSLALAEKGYCKEALPVLKQAAPRATEKDLKFRLAMSVAQCAMSLNDTESAVDTLLLLKRDFPHNPEVLYISAHYYSEIANRASQELVTTAPNSPQALELRAEAFESQAKWNEAEAEYRKILREYPRTPNVHYRLGQVLLSEPESAATTEEAVREFQAELELNPSNASAEFVLGELARRQAHWDEAIQHFKRATGLDVGFSEAFLALGMSLVSDQKFSEAIAPLDAYVKMEPSDPAGHYQLAIAYSRSGHKEEAEREIDLQRKTSNGSQPDSATPRR